VTSKDIVEAIAAKGYQVDKKQLVLADALKEIGEHSVAVRLGNGVEATVKVTIAKA
jgi:large subunit ribosomal protein L9